MKDATIREARMMNRNETDEALEVAIEGRHLSDFLEFISEVERHLGFVLEPAELAWVMRWVNPRRNPRWVADVIEKARSLRAERTASPSPL